MVQQNEFYVSLKGKDAWSGRLKDPNEDLTDGPFATIPGARDALRAIRRKGEWTGPATVWIREGSYFTAEPITFTTADSAPVTYAAYPGERAVIDGGRALGGWHAEERNGQVVWVTQVPEVASGKWDFRQLFVNGERRLRPRWPKQGFFRMEDVPDISISTVTLFDGSNRFRSVPGDMQEWHNLQDIDVMVFHWWVDERMPIASFDPQTRIVTSSRSSAFALKSEVGDTFADYYLENVLEALSEPGEWYVDLVSGHVYYMPMPGEQIENSLIIAPVAQQLLLLNGDPDTGSYIEYLRFQGLEFAHTDWRQHSEGVIPFTHIPQYSGRPISDIAASPQSAMFVPGVIAMEGARSCAIEGCVIKHVGYYGIELADGTSGIRLVGNTIYDTGAGGVKINGSNTDEPPARRTGGNIVTDNHIHHGGNVFYNAVGIFSMHSANNQFSHNHIHHLVYSAISCGWVWGYADNVSCNNRIENNDIHDLGFGLLSDMGGIYTLGVQPGTVIRGNLIHDIEKNIYGGWGIYLDEGSSYITVENNICYNVSSQGFFQHYGRENIIRNNIFAFGREGQAGFPKPDGPVHRRNEADKAHQSLLMISNIFVSRNQPAFIGGINAHLENGTFHSDLNIFWDDSNAPWTSNNGDYNSQAVWEICRDFTWEQWQQTGRDLHSAMADPGFADLGKYDFTLSEHSPARKLGFKSIITNVGPRSHDK